MCTYKLALEKANFTDCGGVLKFIFYFLPSKCVNTGRLTVGHVSTLNKTSLTPATGHLLTSIFIGLHEIFDF